MTVLDRAIEENQDWCTVKSKKQTKAMGTDDPLRLTVGFLLCGFTISDNEGLLLLYMLDRKRRRLRKRRKSSRTS